MLCGSMVSDVRVVESGQDWQMRREILYRGEGVWGFEHVNVQRRLPRKEGYHN